VRPTKSIALRPSLRLSAALIASHAAALAGLLATDLPWWGMAPIAAGIGVSLWNAVRRHALLRSPGSIVALRLNDDGTVIADFGDGSSRQAGIHPASSVFPYLTIGLLTEAGRALARPLVIAADSSDVEELRRLRVWMRFRSQLSGEDVR
jgi:toxin CptA